MDEGNVLTPLTRVRNLYLEKASHLAAMAWSSDNGADKLRTSKFYTKAADAVDRLITLGNCQQI